MKKMIITAIALIALQGCSTLEDFWGAGDCSDEMESVESSNGSNYEISNYDADGVHNEVWWYWNNGRRYSFTWGDGYDNCSTSTYTFTPV